MSYATLQNMLDRGLQQELIELTDKVNSPQTTINETMVQDALDDAEAEINSYITAASIPTPLNPIPRVIVQRNIEIARYRLWGDRVSDKVKADWEFAMDWLQRLADGRISLGDNEAPTEQTTEDTPVAVSQAGETVGCPARTFTKHSLRHF